VASGNVVSLFFVAANAQRDEQQKGHPDAAKVGPALVFKFAAFMVCVEQETPHMQVEFASADFALLH
jgi:hypothetical protein